MAKRKVQTDELTEEQMIEDQINKQTQDGVVEQAKEITKDLKIVEDEPKKEITIRAKIVPKTTPKENEEDPKANLSIDDMVAQLKNDLIFSSASPSPVFPKVDESPTDTPHRSKVGDIVDLRGNPVKIKERSNSSSIIMGRGV